MSHIPQAKTGLKPPSKIHKAVQGGASTSSPSNSTTTVVRRGSAAPPTKSTATPSSSKTSPSLGKVAGAGGTSGVVKRGSTSSTTATGVSPRASPRDSMISSATSSQQQPKLSRENSETRLQYRRESSSSSIKSTGSESSGSVVRRRGSQSQQAATSAADLKKFFSIGDRVLVSGAKPGVIGFIGETQFAKGDWAGVVLDEPTGKNNGTVAGVRYFECKPQHGVFTKLEKITKINKVTEQLHNEGPNTALEIGDRIVISGTKIGTVRYVGTTGFAKGEWTGVELDEPLGKNDGAVAGTRYFRCEQDYGLFAPVHKVIKTGKKENTKLLTSPPQISEATLNSLSTPAAPKTSRENSVSSPELTPLLLSSASTLGKKAEEADDQTQASPAKTPFHVSLQVVALQEALQDRERQIQTLLEERDFERIEVASATSQVSKAEEELINIRKKHEEASIESTKSIDTLKTLVELAEKEKSELSLQVEEEKRKNEDLLFKLEEEEIILGDELKTDANQIKEQKRKLHENQETISRLHNELENIKAAKSDSDKKAEDMEFQFLEFTEDSSSFQLQLEESQNRVKELESKLTSLQEQHSAQSGEASRGREEQLDKIKQLEKDLNTRKSKCKELEVELQNANIQLKRAQEDNETFKDQVEDFTSKLYSKEHEFASMSEELKLIKAATLELQKQLQLSEAKSQNLSADKTKLENEIAELMKSSGNNSERLTYLNDQLREKDRLINEVKTSLAEAQANAGLLTGEIAQAKESHARDVDRLNKSHDEQIKTLTNQINSLKTEVQRNKDENTRLVQVHRAELETLEQTNHEQITAMSTQIDEKVEQFQNLSEDLNTTKTQLQTTTKERDDFKESQSKIQDEVAMLQENLLKSTTLSETICKDLKTMQTQQENIVKERDTLKEKCSNFESEIQSKQNEVREVNLKLEAVATERSLLTSAQGDTEKKVTEVLEKYDKLNAQHQALLQEKGESVKLCHEKENQVKKVNLEKDVILQEKNTTETKLEELQAQYTALESEITVVKAQSTQKEKELTQLRSSATYGVSQISQLQSQLEEIKSERDQFKSKIVVLEEQSALQQQQMKSLNQEKADAENGKIEISTALSLSQEQLQSLTARLEESERNKAAQSMNASMENDLEATRHVLKLKEDELKKYKQQVLDLKKQIATTGIKQSTNQESQGNADLAVKLVEVEDLLEATQAEKENLDAQLEFLNSVIVDLQRKNEENEQRIELLMSGGSRTNGLLDSPEMDDEPAIPRYNVRLFCDICDVFDEHDTDDCPTQASDPQDDVGSMHHGSRTESRSYCTTCEVFGHWTQDCDDEETF